MSASDGLELVARFKAWLVENNAFVHPDLCYEPAVSGFDVVAQSDVPPDSTIISIPFSTAITPEVSKKALNALLRTASNKMDGWSERQLECTYICMHWVVNPGDSGDLRHRPYIDTLPSSDKLRTPLHFSAVELEAFQGSNLYGATLDRLRDWKAEWQICRSSVAASSQAWADAFTWERYLTASTYISSRAFPSTILSETPSLVTAPSSHPVLLPGIDALNHARGHPVSWVVSSGTPSASSSSQPSLPSTDPGSRPESRHGPKPERSISLVIHTLTPKGTELLNNYGPKPNSELILGYGFSLPNNPDDTIVLKIGGPSAMPALGAPSSSSSSSGAVAGSSGRWEVGRNARGAEPVWDAVLAAVRAQNASSDGEGGEEDEDEQGRDEASIEDELCAADTLAEMAQRLYDRLPPCAPTEGATGDRAMRAEVRRMLEHYVEGQRAILQALVAFARGREEAAVRRARERGLVVEEEEEEEEAGEGE